MMKTLIDLFKTFEKRNSEAFIYRTGIRRFTFKYPELYNSSLKMASYLSSKGIKKGDKVALWAPNSPFWAVCYFGILLNESIVVPVDFAGGIKRAETIVSLSNSKLVIQSNYKFEKLAGVNTVMIEDLVFLLKKVNPIKNFPRSKSKDLAELVYTSGTTGDPKGVMLTHKNIVSNILAACDHIVIPSKFNFLSVLPLSHLFEQTVGFLVPLYRGDKIIYLRTIKPSAMLEAFREENIQATLVVPRLLSLLKNTVEREFQSKGLGGFLRFGAVKTMLSYPVHKKFGHNFQMFVSGGAALPIEVFRFWKDFGFRVIEGYGLTECSPILSANTWDEQIEGSVGKPIKRVKIRLENNELLAKGENIFSGYYENEKETEKAFTKDGWFRTGDIGRLDENGNIFIKSRKKDVIVNASGVNIYPGDIETVLNKIPGVKDSCVLGLDRGQGEEVHVVLLLKNKNVNVSEIIKVANGKLDPLTQIESFSVWKEFDFPRTTTLKIQKFKVKEVVLNENKGSASTLPQDTLIALLANVSKKPELQIKENSILTSDLGLNSLSRLELINYLEQEYRVDLEDTVITQNTTVADLRKLLEKREKVKPHRGLWLWLNSGLGKGIRGFLDFIFQIPLSHLFFSLEIQGLNNLKNIKKPVIFISNHVSYLDQPAIMYSLPAKLRYKTATATREEFFFGEDGRFSIRQILFPYTLVAFNAFLLPQKSGFRKSLSFMGKLIDKGINILVFPEGSRTRTGELGSFMSGLGLMVKELEVPVVPIRIIGMEKIYPRGSKFPKRGQCTVIFGKSLEFTTETPSEIIEKSRAAILNLGSQ